LGRNVHPLILLQVASKRTRLEGERDALVKISGLLAGF